MAKQNRQKQQKNEDPQSAMLARFLPLLNAEQQEALLQELAQPLSQSIRINPLKTHDPQAILTWSKKYQWKTKPIPFCELGYWITEAAYPASKTIEHSLGQFYIQDAASMIPAELFDFSTSKNPLILDMAASPGGKTTHLVARTNDQALILANDSSRDRLTALKIVLQNWGSCHVAITNYAGELFGSWYPETFDAILLDAPCSMQGLREKSSHEIKPITQKEINLLAKRQLKLLESAVSAVKVGGQVVYSTCTLTLEENEMVLNQILEEFPSQLRIDPSLPVFHKLSSPIFSNEQVSLHSDIKNAVRIWPFTFGTAGFFAARITKIDTINQKYKPPPSRPLSQANWEPYAEKELTSLTRNIKDQYGIDLQELINQYHWEIWQHQNKLHCFPSFFLQHFPDLPVQWLGLPLAEVTADELLLTHEFVSRFGHLATRNVFTIAADQIPAWMRGEDLTSDYHTNTGMQIIRDTEGRILGRGYPSGIRLRNLLPNRVLIPDLTRY